MLSSTVNICVLTLVLLSIQHTSYGRPHSQSKREIIKDYFNPLILTPEEFEKRDDGKFYLKKSAHRSDSAVNYVSPENIEDKKVILQNNLRTAEAQNVEAEIAQAQEGKSKPLEETMAEEEISEKYEVFSAPPFVENERIVKDLFLTKSDTIQEEKSVYNKDKASFTPVDPKLIVPPKPNSKDEVAIKVNDSSESEEEQVDQKVTIGQIPHRYPKVIPVPDIFRIPILIPIRQISYRTMSVLPLSPAEVSDRLPLPPAEVSDRLPLPPAEISDRLPYAIEEDIVGEGEHESASLGEITESPIAEDKKDSGYPVAVNIRLPVLPFSELLEDLKDADKQGGEKQTKIVNVLGKKYLMQSNVMKFPSGDNSKTFIRFMSVKPLKKVDPGKENEAASEEAIKKVIEEVKGQEMDGLDKKKASRDERRAEEDKVMTDVEETAGGESFNKERVVEPDILKAEESKIKVQVDPSEENAKEVTDKAGSKKFVKSEENMEPSGEESGFVQKKEKMEDHLMKKDRDMTSKEELFFIENKKKGMHPEEVVKPKKKLEKRKKCRCEEEDPANDSD